jgi:hypothetical protein
VYIVYDGVPDRAVSCKVVFHPHGQRSQSGVEYGVMIGGVSVIVYVYV